MTPDIETEADQLLDREKEQFSRHLPAGREAALAELRFADALRRSAERLSHRSADSARSLGASWREIGEAVGGITPQGAEHRFSAAAKERRAKASRAEWESRDRRRSPRDATAEVRSYESERA
jgi:hypothetical protein